MSDSCADYHIIGLIHVFDVVNIRRGPKNGLTLECEPF